MSVKEMIWCEVKENSTPHLNFEYQRTKARLDDGVTALMEGLTPAQRVMLDQTILQPIDSLMQPFLYLIGLGESYCWAKDLNLKISRYKEMFDFEDLEKLSDYEFVYPALDVLQHAYHKGVTWKDKSLPACCFQDFIIRHTKHRISHGYRRYRELEPEWEGLYVLISDIEKNYTGKTDTDVLEKAVILFDQALLLYHEGNPLPPHLTT